MQEAARLSLSEARSNLGDVVNRVTYTEQPAVITKHGSDAVAIIPYRLLELLTRLEALLDVDKAQKALDDYQTNGGICLDELKKELGLD